MTRSSRAPACLYLAAVLLAGLLPLPGAWSVVALAPVMVWLLAPARPLIGLVVDHPLGRVQPRAFRSSTAPRAPPARRRVR
jgi:hypothetical protein